MTTILKIMMRKRQPSLRALILLWFPMRRLVLMGMYLTFLPAFRKASVLVVG